MTNEDRILPHHLPLFFKLAAELGATIALVKTRKLKPYLKKSEAFKIYSRNKVEYWIADGLITVRKDGDYSAAWRLDRIELELIHKAHQLIQII